MQNEIFKTIPLKLPHLAETNLHCLMELSIDNIGSNMYFRSEMFCNIPILKIILPKTGSTVCLFLFGNLRSNKDGEKIVDIVLDTLSETIKEDKYSINRDFFIKKHYEKD